MSLEEDYIVTKIFLIFFINVNGVTEVTFLTWANIPPSFMFQVPGGSVSWFYMIIRSCSRWGKGGCNVFKFTY